MKNTIKTLPEKSKDILNVHKNYEYHLKKNKINKKNINNIINYLNTEQLNILNKMLKIDKIFCLKDQHKINFINLFALRDAGLIFINVKNNKILFYMPQDLKKRINIPKNNFKIDEINTIMDGIINAYGILGYQEFKIIFKEYVKENYNLKTLISLNKKIKIKNNMIYSDAINVHNYIKKPLKKFDKKNILLLGKNIYYQKFDVYNNLKNWLKKEFNLNIKYFNVLIDYYIFYTNTNHSDKEKMLIDMLISFIPHINKHEIKIFVNYLNKIIYYYPLWYLRGYSLSELNSF